MAKQLNYQVNLSVNKNDLNELLTALKQIQQDQMKALNLGTLTTNLDKAGDAAYRLEQILNRSWNSKIGQLDLSKLNTEIKNTYGSVSKLKENLESVGMGQYFNQLQSNVLNTNLQLKNTNKLLDAMATSMANTVKWGITSSIFNNITSQIQKAWSYSKSLDTSLNSIRIVTGKSADEMERYARVANKAAKELGQSTRDYTDASLIYYQQGLGEEETQARTETTLKAANVTGQTGQEVSEQLTAVWNGYKVSAEETELYVDKLAAVAAGTAADLEELSTGMSKVASAANSAGVDIDQLNGMLSTVISVTREAPETIGSSFKTIFARLGDLALDGEDEYGVTLGKVSGQLQELGIQVLTEKGEMRDMGDIIEDTAAKWDTWTQAQRQAAAVAMAGKMQYSRLIALFDNWDMYSKAVEMSSNAIGTLQEQQDIYMESTEAHLKKLSTEAERTYDILFDTNAVNDMSDALTGLLKIFNNFLAGMGGGLQTITGLAAMTGNIFNKQIGVGLNRLAQNRDIEKQNEQAVYTAMAFSQVAASKTNSEAESQVYEDMRLKSQEILALKERISTEDMNRLLTLRKEAEQESLITAALEEQNARQTSMVAIENSLKNQSKLIKEQKREYAAITENVEIIEQRRGSRYVEDRNQMLESQRDILSRIITMKDEELLTDEQIATLEKAQQRDSQGRVLTKKQIADLQNISQQVIEQELQEEKEITRQKELQQQLDNGALEAQQIKSQQKQQALADAQANLERQIAIQDMVKGLTTLITLGTTFSGIWKTINNEELTGWEKFEQISTTLLITLPMIISGFSSIGKILPGINAMIGATATGTKVLGSSALAATIEIHGLKLAMWEVYLIIAAIVAIVGLVASGIKALSDEYHADAIAAEEAAKSAQNLNKEYQELKTSVDEFKSTVSDYKDARRELEDLDKDTQEYGDTLKEVNEKAEKLLETNIKLQAIATRTSEGLIVFDPKGLEEYEKEQDRILNNAQRTSAQSQYRANQLQIKSNITDTLRKIDLNIDASTLNELSNIYTETGTIINEDIDKLTTADDQLKDQIKNNIGSIIDLISSNSTLEKANNYLAGVIVGEHLQDPSYDKDFQSKDEVQKNAITAGLRDTLKVTEERNSGLYNMYKENLEEQWQNGKNAWDTKTPMQSIAKKYAEAKGWTYNDVSKSSDWIWSDYDQASFSESDGNVSKDTMIDFLASRHAADSMDKINEWQNYSTIEGRTAAIAQVGKELNEKFDLDTLYADFSDFAANIDKTIEDINNIPPAEKERLKEEITSIGTLLDSYDWKGEGYASGSDFAKAFNAAIEEQYNELEYYRNQYKTSTANADTSQRSLDILSKGDLTVLDKKENEGIEEFLTKLESKYEELGAIQDRTSHQYLQTLREIKEQEETNAAEAIKNLKERQSLNAETQKENLESLEKEWNELSDEQKEEAIRNRTDLYVNIVAKTEELENTLEEIQDADYKIQMQIEADLASDVKDAFGLADELEQLKDSVHDDLTYTFEEAQELINKGYGEMFTNAKETAENTIQVNKDVLNAYIDDKQAEIETDKEAKIAQLENQKTLLQAQRQALVAKLGALQEAANAENEVDAATALQKVQNSEKEYQAATEALNASLKDEAEGATNTEKINSDLFNNLGGMYETDSLNQQQAEVDATNTQAREIQTRINNAKALYDAYVSVANQVKASESGGVVPFNAGNTAGGGGTNVTRSTATEGKTHEATTITPQSLRDSGLFDDNGATQQYKDTINTLIKQTQSQINGIDAQIGAADAGIAALRSASKSLDKAQADARPGGSKKNGGGGSKNEPDTMDKVEDEKDRYHDIDIILKQISTDLDRLDKQKEKLFGQGLIDNLNKQLSTLDKQIDATNEKIKIAKGEASELRDTLSAYGASFNADGTLANYTEIYTAQLNYVNNLIDQYNSMSKEGQDAFKDTVEGAKKNFDKFVEDINKYDTLISDTIPGLKDDIQDAVDKQIEIKIEEFTMEIKIRLDMSEAERDWNEFERKVIKGIKDTDILGNARARLKDFNSYYNSESTGEVQSLMKQVQNTQAQLEQMDRTGWSDFYGDNRAQGLEDLKSYNDQLMKSMEDVEDLIEEIKKSYLDMMDEAADKFQDQVDMYEQVKDIIDHDMNIIKLVYGEDSYADLEKYYQMQEDNNNKQLDFLRQQKDFWYAQTQTLEQGSEEWEKAKENWMDAVSEWNSKVEEAVENIQDKYLNTINKIFDELNNKVTSGAGLDYVSEEWELINQNADQYLDTINSLYGIQSLENKYLDAIDQTDNLSAQRKLNDLMNEELDALREKDKLTQYDIDRANMKYEIALKQIALEEAQQNKSTMRLRRDSQGNYTYQYIADNDQIGQLQDELTTLKNELYNFDLEHYRDNLDQVLEIYQEFQEKMKEAAQINDPEERAAMELLLQEQYGELINGLVEQNETIRLNLHESAFTELADLYNIDLNNFQSLASEEQEVLLGQMIPQWDSGIQHMADTFAGEGGFIPTCKDAMEQLNAATETYEQDLNQVQQAAGQDFGDVQRGIDETKTKTEELIQDNGILIQTYQDQLNAIQNVINELQSLCSQYNAVKIAAQQAAEAAYNYWRAVNGEAANAAGNNVSGGNSNSGSSGSNSRSSNNSSSGSGGSGSAGGDGATIGNQITYSGSYYYDSFGTKPSGSKYSGVADGVTIDIVNNNPYGIHIKSSDGRYPDLGWIKRNQVTRWNTGGYTGDWGDDSGRLAILDRKELILNKDDTANMLNILQLTRDFMNSMNNVLLSRMINSVNGVSNTGMGMVNEDTLEQNVHIDATFPNVKDAREVEEALNNLVNVASQRIGRNTKR